MNIRWKVATLIATLFALLGVTEIVVAKKVLMPSFVELEHTEADVAMRRIQFALDRTLAQLELQAASWGNWTDAWRFAHDRNRTFIDEQVTGAGLKQLNINSLLFTDLDGNIIASAAIDLHTDAPLDLDLTSRRALAPDFPWRGDIRDGRTDQGLLQTNRGILMIAAAPVLDGFGHGPPRGMVIMGRLVSPREIEQIGAQAQAQLSMAPLRDSSQAHELIETNDVTEVYQTFDDIYGHPLLRLRVDVPREITRRGYSAVQYASAYLMGAAVVVVLALVILLNRVVLDPLGRVTRHAVAIGEDKNLNTRLGFERKDEIGVLAREFDRMVARVAESRRQLIDQSFQAGFAELAKGVLHNLGNAMTPIGVRLSGIRTCLRSVPAKEAQLAVAELARTDIDPARRADLAEFVRLACGKLASAVKAAEDDAEIISRQTAIVQSALTEQMRATRNEHVIESVQLPELLAQSIEVVPDAARQRLLIEADPSLEAAGVLSVPRTVLRLVLQNFIINAADAVRDSGQAQGRLCVRAEILPAGEGEDLHLCCTDDGIGIAAEHLERIFEKGFSTKSKDSNFGIGLHWCANTVGALGGRIWATSEGLGRGASLHITLPLASREAASARAA
ncbi:MAG TPA: CHASE4 domain-containing protein [Steroidobacteraceae bacterium]|nr:CHASE4 domain-containing protein [Steroidobacteraceae bacterium]